jgi:hypothetical protein
MKEGVSLGSVKDEHLRMQGMFISLYLWRTRKSDAQASSGNVLVTTSLGIQLPSRIPTSSRLPGGFARKKPPLAELEASLRAAPVPPPCRPRAS